MFAKSWSIVVCLLASVVPGKALGREKELIKIAATSLSVDLINNIEGSFPGVIDEWINQSEDYTHSKIQVTTHEEDGFIDFSCLNCDIFELESQVLQLASWNELTPVRKD